MTITSPKDLSTKGRLLLSLWQQGKRTEAQVQAAATSGAITQEEADYILNQPVAG